MKSEDVVSRIDREVEETLIRKVKEAQQKLDEWRQITGRTPPKPTLVTDGVDEDDKG